MGINVITSAAAAAAAPAAEKSENIVLGLASMGVCAVDIFSSLALFPVFFFYDFT